MTGQNPIEMNHSLLKLKYCILHLTFCILLFSGCSQAPSARLVYTPEEYDARLGVWYNYSTVDWAQLDTLYYRPYNCDWPESYDAQVGENHPSEVDANVWHLLQNARTKFHQDNLPLRSTADAQQRAALDAVEASFDTVFVRYMSGDYHLRAFVDAYQAVLPAAIDQL